VQPFPGGPSHVYRFISGSAPGPMCELGWKSLGVLELTALPSIKEEHWIPEVQETDALLVWGGSPLYLCYWMRESGLANLLPSLRRETVYVGTSGGAMVATPDFGGETYDESEPLTSSDRALGLVDFSVFPHLEREDMPDTSLANIERWAAGIPVPAYAIDDQTAIKVVDDTVEVVSEGHWKLFTPSPEAN
jgi:dipeptidase E